MAWYTPRTIEEAMDKLAEPGGKIICGGTDLFVNWPRRQAMFEDANWVDIHRLPELKRIVRTDEGIELGAAVTAAEIWQSELLKLVPALQQAAKIVGGWQIQNRASIGGNIANASPAADMIIPLAAFKARVNIVGIRGRRTMLLSDTITGPRQTVLAADELIESVLIPERMLGAPQQFLRHDQRGATDISIVSAAVVLQGTASQIEWGSAAVGAANARPLVLPEQDLAWAGKLTTDKIERIAEAYAASSRPISDVRASADYRHAMVKVYVQRAALALFELEA